MAKILFILMPKDYQETEFNTPYHELLEAGHTVDVAGLAQGNALGHKGAQFTPNKLLEQMSDQEFEGYDALVIPGGPGSTTYLWDNQLVIKAIKFFHSHKKLVAAICYACIPVAQTGILTDQHATVYPTAQAKAIFKQLHIEFIDAGCVVLDDENIITAQGPNFASQFSEEILKQLE